MSKLNNETLTSLPRDINIPAYDHTTVSAGIVHFGMGNFFRAHEAYNV